MLYLFDNKYSKNSNIIIYSCDGKTEFQKYGAITPYISVTWSFRNDFAYLVLKKHFSLLSVLKYIYIFLYKYFIIY